MPIVQQELLAALAESDATPLTQDQGRAGAGMPAFRRAKAALVTVALVGSAALVAVSVAGPRAAAGVSNVVSLAKDDPNSFEKVFINTTLKTNDTHGLSVKIGDVVLCHSKLTRSGYYCFENFHKDSKHGYVPARVALLDSETIVLPFKADSEKGHKHCIDVSVGDRVWVHKQHMSGWSWVTHVATDGKVEVKTGWVPNWALPASKQGGDSKEDDADGEEDDADGEDGDGDASGAARPPAARDLCAMAKERCTKDGERVLTEKPCKGLWERCDAQQESDGAGEE